MKLTKSADFAIRIIIFLAGAEKSSTMTELSERLAIPYHNLTKLVQALSKQQILATQKGKYGGVSLFVSPDEVSIKDIIEVIDGPTKLSDCLNHENLCKLSGNCKLKTVLGTVQEKINKLMDDVKISQLV
jgi:Rrf2 family transcriptional regulator, nitric oxide-sensitive transcriptional repressor